MRHPPTIQDVAGALGMHKSTVSLALSGKGNVSAATRQRVRTAARELGYEPNPVAQRLATGLNNDTVCLFSGGIDVGLVAAKLYLLQQELCARALDVPLYTGHEPSEGRGEAQAVRISQLCRQRPRAIVCATHRVHPAVFPELQGYQRAGGIVVSYDSPVPLACDQVIFDREDNAYQAARHLLECGHRRVGLGFSILPGYSPDAPGDPQNTRLRGFRRALAEWGAPVRDEWLFRLPTYEQGGAEMARRFLQLRDRPTGLCIVNDYVALAFMVEVMREGVRVPEDVSIVGHDNQTIASYCPVPLTSVSQPAERIVAATVEMLLDRIENGVAAAPRTRTIRGELVRRDSVAAVGEP